MKNFIMLLAIGLLFFTAYRQDLFNTPTAEIMQIEAEKGLFNIAKDTYKGVSRLAVNNQTAPPRLDIKSPIINMDKQVDTTTSEVSFYLGEHLCRDIYVGEKFKHNTHQVLALWPNIEEKKQDFKPIIFSRNEHNPTKLSNLTINNVDIRSPALKNWSNKQDMGAKVMLQNLTADILKQNSAIRAIRYKIKPLGANSFSLEDLQLIHTLETSIDSVELTLLCPDRETSYVVRTLGYSLTGV